MGCTVTTCRYEPPPRGSCGGFNPNNCIDNYRDMICAIDDGHRKLDACSGARIEYPSSRSKGSYRTPTVVIPDKFEIKCPDCDCEFIRQFNSRAERDAQETCPFFASDVDGSGKWEGFRWYTRTRSNKIRRAKQDIIALTAFQTDLSSQPTNIKMKSQAKANKCGKDGKGKGNNRRQRVLKGEDALVETTEVRSPKGRPAIRSKERRRAQEGTIGGADQVEDVCAFFADPEGLEEDIPASAADAIGTDTGLPYSREDGTTVESEFSRLDTDANGVLTCAEVVADGVYTCEDFKTAFPGGVADLDEVLAYFRGELN